MWYVAEKLKRVNIQMPFYVVERVSISISGIKLLQKKDKHIIINGECYCDGGNVENPNDVGFLGCSGRRFWIRFFDGREITTNNLWYQGKVPDDFLNELPNTAEFYYPEQAKTDKLLF